MRGALHRLTDADRQKTLQVGLYWERQPIDEKHVLNYDLIVIRPLKTVKSALR